MLNAPYSMRRTVLESIITQVPGRSMLSERAIILEGKMQELEGQKKLREVWAQRIADCEEGLVLKAAESTYGDWKLPWVKVRNITPKPQPLKIHECS